MKKILSFGAGVQSVAMLLHYQNRYDYVVFADTLGEHHETYYYISNIIVPFCKENNIPFILVMNNYGKSLYDYCYDKKIVPSIKYRDCTFKFKIYPIRRFVRQHLHATMKNPVQVDLGFSYDEIERMNISLNKKGKVKYIIHDYPLINDKLTRNDCKNIILEKGFPLPMKSGCWFCPFSRVRDLLHIKKNDNVTWNQIVTLENNGSRFPEILLKGMHKNAKPVTEYTEEDAIKESHNHCKTGWCFA